MLGPSCCLDKSTLYSFMHLKYFRMARPRRNSKPSRRCSLAEASSCFILVFEASDSSSAGPIGRVDPIALSISFSLYNGSLSGFFVKRLAAGEKTLGGYELRQAEWVCPGWAAVQSDIRPQ